MEKIDNYLEILDEGLEDTVELRLCCCMSMSRG